MWQCRSVVAGLCLAYLISTASSSFAAPAPATREQVISQLESGTTDLSNLQAAGLDLSGVDFRGARLFGANLDEANLSNAKLARCNLDLTLMRGTVLVKADLARRAPDEQARWRQSRECNREADLTRAYLSRVNLTGANLDGAKLAGAILTDAQNHNAIFIGATGLKEVLGLDSSQGKESATFDP